MRTVIPEARNLDDNHARIGGQEMHRDATMTPAVLDRHRGRAYHRRILGTVGAIGRPVL